MAEQDDVTPGAPTALSDLVKKRREELRLSLKAVAARTAGPDGEPLLKYSWIHRLETRQKVNAPYLPELEALARALELPLWKLQDAAGAQFFGINTVWSTSGEARALVEHAERLTPEQREQLRRFLAAFSDAR
ncbi:helix-turn-helix domain-containing protein [Streptomyces sp. AV19]|uniref:helix-turn-helix domain-containing protein n=1 Tax=Streptomyces sp. AV19 TaxID=2793068 RepID=UPI0018FE056D|nr:helix-turn-helix domain-containing protein [Streptomyces sp. AV19]MBH1932925.1 helix-turn-helix domain-containing protein [Streptomyces sp. AV19]MDG4531675.1 helix-turn-helix domain-containing protein [Streptomyces sp. AV19]